MSSYLDGAVSVRAGDARQVVACLEPQSIDAVVTDPPYALVSIARRYGRADAAPATVGATGAYARASAGFIGQAWDTGETAFAADFWRLVLRAMKPGAFLVAFGGTRTVHRLACAIEDAGFEIRDMIAWLYGSGFPKSHSVARGIDRLQGCEGETVPNGPPVARMIPGATQAREGWHKTDGRQYQPGRYVPASEEAVAWLGWGTALKPALEPIVVARAPLAERSIAAQVVATGTGALNIDGCRIHNGEDRWPDGPDGRWPANVLRDNSAEVRDRLTPRYATRGDPGPARFFYSAKADAIDRAGSNHPTVKPVDLMAWLVRLVTPPDGLVLDPFAGTGTTGEAAWREGCRALLVEREPDYLADIARRMASAESPTRRRAEAAKAPKGAEGTPLFGG